MRKGLLELLAFTFFLTVDVFASVNADVKKGKGDSAVVHFNLGASLYKDGAYYKAIDSFNSAIAAGADSLISMADYNIGNAQYRIGNSKERSADTARSKELYEAALKFYKRSIELNPADREAKFNYEYVSERLKSLQEKRDEKKEEEKEDKDKKQQKQEQEKENEEGGTGPARAKTGDGTGQAGKEEKEEQGEGPGSRGQGPEKEAQEKETGNEKEDKSEEEKAEEGKDQGRAEEEKDNAREGLAAYQAPQPQEETGQMTEQAAKMLLEGYKGEEATGRAVKMRRKPMDASEPLKDW